MPNSAPIELDAIGELTDEHLAALAELLVDLADADFPNNHEEGKQPNDSRQSDSGGT